ncbi:MAG: High-affnity carbon uptake protein Hat/HatR [Bacteroidales bacterium]|nr:High-affnity carbon uptake protein Hat/HatR [Bacteroidales bacterium]
MIPDRKVTEFNPFPGLRPFSPEESDLFFGREGQSSEVVQRLLANKFVTVIGASGSGKSSLIFCGVIPHIRMSEAEKTGEWRSISFRPGTDPFGNFADAIAESGILPESDIPAGDSLKSIVREKEKLSSLLSGHSGSAKGKIIIVIDQFEELFRYGKLGSEERIKADTSKFIDLIVNCTLDKKNEIFFILTMRSDFIGECAHYQGLTQLINDSNYLIPHMTRDNYREVITGPVKYMGAGIDDELVDALLGEVGDRTDQLPVLQHALMRMWTYWQQSGEADRPLGIADYDSVGRMANAMSRHADEAYEELSQHGRYICEVMFKTITEKGSDNKGVRRPTDIKTVSAIAKCTEGELYEVIDKFRIPSRSFITPRIDLPLVPESVIDISHESLMRLWDRLKIWVDEEASSVQMYMRLSEASAMYQRGKAGLWRPPDLQLAINWREKNQPTLRWAERYNPAFERAMVYLSTSEQEFLADEESKIRMQKRQLKRSRITAMILGVAAIISIGFMLFAFMKKLDADRQTIRAEEQTQIASEQKTRAEQNLELANQEKLRADEEARTARSKEEEARIEKENAETQRSRAETNAELARRQEQLALEKQQEAVEQRLLAEEKEREAVAERERAFSLRMLAVGKQMSVKSLQVEGQQDLQTLLAYQAYIFNKRYQGAPNDADIYSGLYNAVKNYGGENYKVFKGHQGEIRSVAFVPGKNEFFTSGQDGKIIRWLLDGKPEDFEVIYSGTNSIEVLAVSPDASWLASGDDNAVIRMIPLNGDRIGFELKGHSDKIKSIVFSYDGNYLYSAGLDGKVLKWDIAARTSRDLSNSSVKITSIDVSSRDNYLAGISEDGDVLVWDPAKSDNIFSLEIGDKVITSIRFEPATSILAIGDINGYVELWDVEKRVRVTEGVKGHSARVSAISFNPAFNQIATASFDQTIRIWNRSDFTEPPISFSDNDGHVLTIQFSSKGDALVSTSREGSMVSRASHADILAENICFLVTRNMTSDEWAVYVGRDIEWEKTCDEKDINIRIERR